LPEAQLDRFMLKVNVSYPSYDEELELYKNITNSNDIELEKILNKEQIFEIQKLVKNIYISDSIYEYVTNIIDASRNPSKYNLEDIAKYIKYGISPR
jgi:MoxR-like ATPase